MSAGQPPFDSPEIRRLTPVLGPGHTYASVTDKISAIVLTRPTSLGWFIGFAIAFGLTGLMTVAIGWLFIKGTGIWGINIPIGWGFAIVNFVWWIGIGHAGTLISAILFLLNQKWRTSINRFAEAMTLFAVACAGIFPLIHTGRPWMAFYMFPYPSTMGIWPQFRSPLIWDVFAVSTYGTVSLMFWFVGLIPDLATLRDRAIQHGLKLNEYELVGPKRRVQCRDEADIFKALDLDYIPPELREHTGEVEAAAEHRLPRLLESDDLRGIFHNHSDWSDGNATLAQMNTQLQLLYRAGKPYHAPTQPQR